ncbi:MAG: DUF3494 domain-containing protein [Ferruginibacter sp.]|nr:DUF3494 domain-containing protein [Ferruginibacter sp.]
MKNVFSVGTIILLLFFYNNIFAQAPNLGSVASFVLYTSGGAVGNTAISRIKGDIGTNSGAVTGFGTSVVSGNIHIADAVTAQCTADLLSAYTQLSAAVTTASHVPVLGNGETLYAGVYQLAAAGSVVSVLTLDAQADTNAVFIFKVGGAFTTAAAATILLVNGASAGRVFWIAEGEISMAARTSMKGTLIANNGAISLGAGGRLEGRMLSTTGAVAVDNVSTTLQLPFADSAVLQAPNLGTAAKFVLFTVTGAVGNTGISQFTGDIGTNEGAITGFNSAAVNGNLHTADPTTTQCSIDLLAAYNQLNFITATAAHLPVLGNGEILYAGVYALAAAGSFVDTLTLDGQGDPNSIFIFKIGGAFTTAASASVMLVDGASACNVFWVAEGAISMAASTSMKGTMISHNGAISMGAGGILDGRMFSTTGAVSVYGVTASIPMGCTINTTWTGAGETADWFAAVNWTRGVPDGVMGTWIPTTLLPGRVFPIINSGVAVVDSLVIQADASLTINSTLQIKAAILNAGVLNAGSGTIEMSGASSQVIAENTFQNNAVNNLIISNLSAAGVTLAGPLDIYNSLTYSATGMTLNTNDALTLKSTASNTATVGVITGNTITGEVTVEHYIPARKAWYFLSIPTNSTQTIKDSWQEGATNTGSNPVAGYGIQITSDRPTWDVDGFDRYSPNGPSIKKLDQATGSWVGITNTNASDIEIPGGYMTFIRGDRTANSFTSPATPTILRTKGYLFTGDQPAIVANANEFISVGNPYTSLVDLRNIAKSGLKDFFYIWDPFLGNSSGYGAYQTFSYDGSNYTVTPGMGSYGPAGSAQNLIQGSQAFLVQATALGGSINFNEAAKIGSDSRAIVNTAAATAQLRINLFGLKADNTEYMADGLLINFDENYSNNIDDHDALKSLNNAENLSIRKANILLVVEKRHSITGQDTLVLNLTNTKRQRYRFEFNANQIMHPGSICFLEDKYLQTVTALDFNGNSVVSFLVDNVAGSYAADRFRIIFSATLAPVPVTFTSINAIRKNNDIYINWKVQHEISIQQYETERAGSSLVFETVSVTLPNRNNGCQNYVVLDKQPLAGWNYYRIKAVDQDGKKTYTNIVKVFFEKEKQEIKIFPNPIVDGIVKLQLTNKPVGLYVARLLNNFGQELLVSRIQNEVGSGTLTITFDKKLPHGIYQLNLTEPAGNNINMTVCY